MGPTSEDSPRPRTASTNATARPWSILADACRQAAEGVGDPTIVQRLLRRALDATGTERAFVVRGNDPASSVTRLSATLDRAGLAAQVPSRTVLLRVLAGRRAFACPDVRLDPLLAGGRSVRSLRLRCVLSAPVPDGGGTTSLLLDGREDPALGDDLAERLVTAFAALVALVARRETVDAGSAHLPLPSAAPPSEIVGRSSSVRRLRDWISRVAPSELSVLIRGETGSGKELAARMIHARSRRRDQPFVAVNCAAFTDTLLDAELFGAERGSYTGADRQRPGLFRLARSGTLFLDEVAEMSPSMQAKLLRVLQESKVRPVGGESDVPVDVRVLAATHHDMAFLLERGAFRADLFYRLAVVEVRVPPLRERLEDLEAIVDSLRHRLCRETGSAALSISGDAWPALRARRWPGNVRELHAALARALLRARGRPIRECDIDPPLPSRPERRARAERGRGIERGHAGERNRANERLPLDEREMIVRVLGQASGNVAAAARRIGWTRQKLYRRMRSLAVPR